MADVFVERRMIPLGVFGVAEQRRDVSAVHRPGQFEPRLFEEGHDEVRSVDRMLADLARWNRAWPADDQRRAIVGVIRSQLGSESVLAHREALVGREDNQCVFELP